MEIISCSILNELFSGTSSSSLSVQDETVTNEKRTANVLASTRRTQKKREKRATFLVPFDCIMQGRAVRQFAFDVSVFVDTPHQAEVITDNRIPLSHNLKMKGNQRERLHFELFEASRVGPLGAAAVAPSRDHNLDCADSGRWRTALEWRSNKTTRVIFRNKNQRSLGP